MTHRENDSRNVDIFESILSKGLEGLPEVLTSVINQAMEIERGRYLNARPYERSEERKSHANGFKAKQLNTRIGKLQLWVPQTRDSAFYPSCLERGMRSERALKLSIAEMYFQGVSTRKVKAIMEELCGFELTSTEVSRCAKLLDEELAQFRERQLGIYHYVYLDALYEKVRYAGQVRDCAVLLAIGVNPSGHREILGLSISLSEHEVHWREFLTSLQERGLRGTQLFISDAHAGLKAARMAVFPGIAWQRCHFHLQQNAQAYVTKQSRKIEVASVIRGILTAANEKVAQELLKEAVQLFKNDMPKLASWLEENLAEGFTHFQFPVAHHRQLRTSNMLERVNKEIRRRTRVVGVFPNTESCERLISAVLFDINDEWQAGKRYVTF